MNPVIVTIICLVVIAVLLYLAWRFLGNSKPAPTAVSPQNHAVEPLELTAGQGTTLVIGDGGHSAQHGHYLASACQLAYLPPEEGVPRYLSELNLSARLVSVDNTQAYVGENATSIVVAFRGSESPSSMDGFKDWLLTNARNFLVLPEGAIGVDFAAAGVGARFHRGFMEALAEVWEPLHATIEQAVRRRERPVWITGHSLGGAIALMAAWRLHQRFIPIHQICTFGAPMIGNNAAAEAYHREFPGQIVRYVDQSDMVPKLPTMSLLSNEYDHVQREIVVGNNDATSATLLLANAAEQTPNGEVDQLVADNLWSDLHTGIAAHLMGNYISRISEQLG